MALKGHNFFCVPLLHGSVPLIHHSGDDNDSLKTPSGLYAYLLHPQPLPDCISSVVAPSNLLYSTMSNPKHGKDHLNVFMEAITSSLTSKNPLTPENLAIKFNEFDTRMFEEVNRQIHNNSSKRAAYISRADSIYKDQSEYFRSIQSRYGDELAHELDMNTMDLVYRDSGITWDVHRNFTLKKMFGSDPLESYNKICLYFPDLQPNELKNCAKAVKAAMEPASAAASAEDVGIKKKNNEKPLKDIEIQILFDGRFIMFHIKSKREWWGFQGIVDYVKEVLSLLYGKDFCEKHLHDGIFVDSSCSNLDFYHKDITIDGKREEVTSVSYGKADCKDPVSKELLDAAVEDAGIIISLGLHGQDYLPTNPYKRRTVSAGASAGASEARVPRDLRYVVVPNSLSGFVPRNMQVANIFAQPPILPPPNAWHDDASTRVVPSDSLIGDSLIGDSLGSLGSFGSSHDRGVGGDDDDGPKSSQDNVEENGKHGGTHGASRRRGRCCLRHKNKKTNHFKKVQKKRIRSCCRTRRQFRQTRCCRRRRL